MLPTRAIDASILQAYRDTEYRVFGPSPFVLRVGQVSTELLAAQRRHAVACSAFVTACNPHGCELPATRNAARQARLRGQLVACGLTFLPGLGQHPDNGWPGEDSFLVFGMALADAQALAASWEQNALLWASADAIPELIVLR